LTAKQATSAFQMLSADSVFRSIVFLFLGPEEMSVSRGNHAEKNCSFETYLEPVCTSTPKKGQSRCLDLYDSDSSSVDLGTPAKRRSSPSKCWVDLNDSNSTSERWSDCTPIKEAMVESTPQNVSQSVSVDMVDSDDESVIGSTYDDQHVDGAAKQIKMKPSIEGKIACD